MPPTTLQALTRPCTQFHCSNPGGTNTIIDTYYEPSGWSKWEDFTYDTITSIFGAQLAKSYHGKS